MGNKALAFAGADFFDALREYDHLPTLAAVSIGSVGDVLASVLCGGFRSGLRAVAEWADAFGVSVRFTFDTKTLLCDVDAWVELAGRELRVRHTAHRDCVRELDFGIDVTQGRHAEVSALRVLRVVTDKAVAS